ncbi:hypothetical protein V8F06_003793 [Rhypophila decipiens]
MSAYLPTCDLKGGAITPSFSIQPVSPHSERTGNGLPGTADRPSHPIPSPRTTHHTTYNLQRTAHKLGVCVYVYAGDSHRVTRACCIRQVDTHRRTGERDISTSELEGLFRFTGRRPHFMATVVRHSHVETGDGDDDTISIFNTKHARPYKERYRNITARTPWEVPESALPTVQVLVKILLSPVPEPIRSLSGAYPASDQLSIRSLTERSSAAVRSVTSSHRIIQTTDQITTPATYSISFRTQSYIWEWDTL